MLRGEIEESGNYKLCVERNVEKLLYLLGKTQQKGTFFVLEWIVKQLPLLIKRIHEHGYEIASHGYAHELVYLQKPHIFQ
ncbi:polysaccharide deacetylase family protein [Ectobacillus sp. JY-23]|uniref:polysaccharide deacetylase family protein n=1 Tax=Ectobacillus sp. JY-23 TaxID=2933872 RepID=UPI0034A04238